MGEDCALARAIEQIVAVRRGDFPAPAVTSFFDQASFTASHVVQDPATRGAAVIDSVMDFDPASGRTSSQPVEAILDHVRDYGLSVDWLLETHAHADHLSAAPFLKAELGGAMAIGAGICSIQKQFASVFNESRGFACDGSQFDRLFGDGDSFMVGDIPAIALHVPGHTPADIAYVIGDAAFVGDTMFMPDYGTARADFPGGCARQLYHSIRRLMRLPAETRVYLCHDYKAEGRDFFAWETTIGAERSGNRHVREEVPEDDFVAMRTARDATLPMPRLMLPAIQVNMRAGHLPPPEDNGIRYLKLPLNRF